MIKIVARRRIKPECEDEYIKLALEMMEASNAEEGCLGYSLNRSQEDEHLFAVIEYWRDRAAIEAHNASAHFKRIVPQYDAFTAEKYPVEHYVEVG
jgi:quinol monooxygenase YgiN